MSRHLRWGLVLPLFFLIVLYFLREANPGSDCAYCGPSPGFWWGAGHGSPGPREYYRHHDYYDFLFIVQYLPLAFVITAFGGVLAPLIAERIATSRRRPLIAATLTMGILIALAILSDLSSQLRAGGRLPLFLLHNSYYPDVIVALARIFLPAAIMSGLVTFAATRNRIPDPTL